MRFSSLFCLARLGLIGWLALPLGAAAQVVRPGYGPKVIAQDTIDQIIDPLLRDPRPDSDKKKYFLTEYNLDHKIFELQSKIVGTAVGQGKVTGTSAEVTDKAVTLNLGAWDFLKTGRHYLQLTGTGAAAKKVVDLFSEAQYQNTLTGGVVLNAFGYGSVFLSGKKQELFGQLRTMRHRDISQLAQPPYLTAPAAAKAADKANLTTLVKLVLRDSTLFRGLRIVAPSPKSNEQKYLRLGGKWRRVLPDDWFELAQPQAAAALTSLLAPGNKLSKAAKAGLDSLQLLLTGDPTLLQNLRGTGTITPNQKQYLQAEKAIRAYLPDNWLELTDILATQWVIAHLSDGAIKPKEPQLDTAKISAWVTTHVLVPEELTKHSHKLLRAYDSLQLTPTYGQSIHWWTLAINYNSVNQPVFDKNKRDDDFTRKSVSPYLSLRLARSYVRRNARTQHFFSGSVKFDNERDYGDTVNFFISTPTAISDTTLTNVKQLTVFDPQYKKQVRAKPTVQYSVYFPKRHVGLDITSGLTLSDRNRPTYTQTIGPFVPISLGKESFVNVLLFLRLTEAPKTNYSPALSFGISAAAAISTIIGSKK